LVRRSLHEIHQQDHRSFEAFSAGADDLSVQPRGRQPNFRGE
jgi:hypothetical protein